MEGKFRSVLPFSHTHTHACTYAHTQTQTHAYAYKYMHTNAHTHKQTHMRTQKIAMQVYNAVLHDSGDKANGRYNESSALMRTVGLCIREWSEVVIVGLPSSILRQTISTHLCSRASTTQAHQTKSEVH